jgi:tetratricopeptide (TPR) repeat protein
VIPGIERWPDIPTPAVLDFILAGAYARRALLDARHAESTGEADRAACGFERALALADRSEDRSADVDLTRAAALAGLARLRGDAARRRQAAKIFRQVPRAELDGADLADWASVDEEGAGAEPDGELVAYGDAPSWVFFAAAERALASERPKDALRPLERAVRAAPLDPHLVETYASVLEEQGEKAAAAHASVHAAALRAAGEEHAYERAIELANKAVALDRRNLTARLLLGDLLRLTGEYDRAVDRLKRVLERAEKKSALELNGRRALARAYAVAGRRRDALKTLTSVLHESDDDPGDLGLAGDLNSMMLGKDRLAEKHYRRALHLAPPDRLDVIDSAMFHYLSRGRLDKAREILEQAVERAIAERRGESMLYVVLGELRVRLKEPGAPQDDIERARLLGLPPDVAWAMIGEIRAEDGDRAGALQALTESTKLAPDNADRHRRRGQLALELDLLDESLAELRRAAELEPGNLETHVLLAQVLARTDLDGAEAAIESALEAAPHPALLALRATVRLKRGDVEAATADFLSSVHGDPTLGWPGAELLRLLEQRNDESGAAEIRRLIIESGSATVVETAAELQALGDPHGAETLIADYLEHRGRNVRREARARVLMLRARIRGQLNDRRGAERDIERVLKDAPSETPLHALARVELADLLVDEEPSRAVKEARGARRNDRGSSEVAQRSARVIAHVEGPAAALEELHKAIEQVGADPNLLLLQAELLLQAGEPEAVLETLGGLVERWPTVDVAVLRGKALARLGEYAQAAEILQPAFQADSDNSDLRTELGKCLIEVGRAEEAIVLLAGANPTDPADEQKAILHALALEVAGRADQAWSELDSLLSADERRYYVREQLVRAAWYAADTDLAQEHLDILLADEERKLDPEVARLLWLLGDSERALERLGAIVTSDPTNVFAWSLMSRLCCERQDYGGAIEAARTAMSLAPKNVSACIADADALLAADRPEEAVLAVAGSDHPYARLKHAEILFTVGQDAEAASVVEDLLSTSAAAADARIVVRAADLLTWAEDSRRAAAILDPLLRPSVRRPFEALRAAGVLLSSVGRFRRAVDAFEACRIQAPSDPWTDERLPWAYSNLKSPPFDDLFETIDRALRRSPKSPWLLKARADALLQSGDEREAFSLYERVLNELLASVTAIRDRHSLAGWCCYRLRSYEFSIDHFLRATSIETPRASGDRFDLGLVLLAADQPVLAEDAYDRGFAEEGGKGDDLRYHGLLRVAQIDLDEAVASKVVAPKAAKPIQSRLKQEVSRVRPAFDDIRGFMDHVAAVCEDVRTAAESEAAVPA